MKHITASKIVFWASASALAILIARTQGHISILEFIIAIVISYLPSQAVSSYQRCPEQFVTALWERAVYVAVMLFSLGGMLFFLLLKIVIATLKLGVWLVVGIAYLIWPFDLIPDFFVGLGQIDDALLILGIIIWGIGRNWSQEALYFTRAAKPRTRFP